MTAPTRATPRPGRQTQAQKKRDAELDRGLAFTDDDGTRLVVRIRDVKGSHDKALREAVGCDFMGLLQEFSKRQGSDLLAAVIWFGRLVNGRDAGTYEQVLDEVGYADYLTRDFDQPKDGEQPPEA